MNDYFLLDPDYKDFPEKQKLKFLTVYGEQHTFIVLAVLLLICYTAFLYIFLIVGFPREYSYWTNGVRTQGKVIEQCQPSQNWYVYSFEAEDAEGKTQQYTGKTTSGKNTPCLKLDNPVTVEYLRDRPESSAREISEGSSGFASICGISFGVIFALVAIRFALNDIRAFLQARVKYPLLQQATTIVEGKVIGVKNSKKDHIHGRTKGAYCIEVEYEFIINKRLLTGKQIKDRNDLSKKPLPQYGTPVRILYADAYVML